MSFEQFEEPLDRLFSSIRHPVELEVPPHQPLMTEPTHIPGKTVTGEHPLMEFEADVQGLPAELSGVARFSEGRGLTLHVGTRELSTTQLNAAGVRFTAILTEQRALPLWPDTDIALMRPCMAAAYIGHRWRFLILTLTEEDISTAVADHPVDWQVEMAGILVEIHVDEDIYRGYLALLR